MTDCSRCKKTDLSWDEQYFDNTGKWRLFDHNLERPHQCPTEKIKAPEEKTWCPYCDPQTRKPMPKSKLQNHVKTAHLGFW